MRLLTLLLFTATLTAQQHEAELSGRWRSLETSKGGIGAMFHFYPGGAVEFSPGAVVQTSYRVEGDQLILPPATVNGPESKQRITWITRDKLRLGKDAETSEFTRADHAEHKDQDLTGEWIAMRDMAGSMHEVHYIFSADGKGLFLIPFVTQSGHYTVTGDSIRIELPERQTVEGKFKVEGDTLTIPGPRGAGESKFARY